MANYIDSFVQALQAAGYSTNVSDAWNQYLQANTDIQSTNTDDMLAAWLQAKGYSGSIPDMLQQYAVASGYASHTEQVLANAFLFSEIAYDDLYTAPSNGSVYAGMSAPI